MDIAADTLNPLTLIFIMAIMGLLPFFLTLVTAYVKIIVVTFLIRNALGIQQVPPTMVLTSLAMILSVFVMAPVGVETYKLIQAQNLTTQITPTAIIDTAINASDPLKKFLQNNTDEAILNSFTNTARKIWPEEIHDAISKDSFISSIRPAIFSKSAE